MVSVTLVAAQWLLTNVGLPVLKAGIDQLMGQMGMKDPPVDATNAQRLVEVYIQQLDEHIQRIESKIDEDRLAKLLAALKQVSEAHKTNAEREYLTNALYAFNVVTNYPGQGTTGGYTNAQLRCVAFLGMAAAHAVLEDPQQLVAEKMTEAVHADTDTARMWLGNDLVDQIISHFPPLGIACPKCGHQNPAGSHYCNQDGHPLTPGQNSTPVLSSDERGQPGIIITTFNSVVYYDSEDYWPHQEEGTLIVRANMLEFLGKQQKILITDIKHVSRSRRNDADSFYCAKVLYGDDSSLKMAFFKDNSGRFIDSTKSMVEAIQECISRVAASLRPSNRLRSRRI